MKHLAPLAFLFLLAGCMVGPNYKRPPAILPPAYRGAAPRPAASAPSATSFGNEQWWRIFQDPVLVHLIHTALANNYDVRIAATRVVEAQAELGITRSNEFPTASMGAGLFTQENAKISKAFPSFMENYGKLDLSVIWDLDFWGKYRRETEAARDEVLSTVWGQRAVDTSVVASVATAYFQLRALDSEIAIAQRTLASRQNSLRLITVLARNGSASGLDLSQARQLVYAASEAIPDLQSQIAQQENLLSILLGQNPGPIPRGRSLVEQTEPQAVPPGLPSELLDRRPDIGSAEASLMAATANIGVVKSELFPDISLTGTGGLETNVLERLVQEPSETWNAAINVSQPIFQAGALRAGVHLAQAQQQQMLLTYRQTILTALEQVSDGLVAYSDDRQYTLQQQHLTQAAQQSDRLSMVLYHNGSASYLQVLTSETNYFGAELGLVQAQLNERLALVQLYQALGGGWQQ
jgi:multidrug efflux system outer membrane protein